MGSLRVLAAQTAVYGISSILGRFLNYLLVPLFTYYFSPAEYGVVAEFYAYAGFLAVLLAFGLETGYFRFRGDRLGSVEGVYATALRFLLAANLAFLGLVLLFEREIAAALRHAAHPQYVAWMAWIVVLDSIASVPFARLRAENRALRFAGIKLVEIVVTVLFSLFFVLYCREAHLEDPGSLAGRIWDPSIGVGYVFIANLIGSTVKWFLLLPELRGIAAGFDRALLARMLHYSLPLVIIGLAGVVNEMLDRAILKYLLPYDMATNMAMLGIYGACYKLSIAMTLFIQAFRYAAEPFFFAHAESADAPRTYAQVLNYFVIFCVFIFLLVTLYIELFQYFIGEPFRVGLPIVPILLLANLFLGIYVNLSVWYKLTDRTLLGASVAIGGALVTVLLNLWLVPRMGYAGAAWATLGCYASMTLASYLLGRRYYPVPYDLGKVGGYVTLGLVLYFMNRGLLAVTGVGSVLSATLFLMLYLTLAWLFDLRRLLGARPV